MPKRGVKVSIAGSTSRTANIRDFGGSGLIYPEMIFGDEPPTHITSAELAKRCFKAWGCTEAAARQRVTRACREKKLPANRKGKVWLIRAEDAENFVTYEKRPPKRASRRDKDFEVD